MSIYRDNTALLSKRRAWAAFGQGVTVTVAMSSLIGSGWERGWLSLLVFGSLFLVLLGWEDRLEQQLATEHGLAVEVASLRAQGFTAHDVERHATGYRLTSKRDAS